jgi:hypothetical protein
VCLLRGTSYILCSAHTVYLCVLCGSENKQRLFHCTALTGWFYNRDGVCLLRGTDWVLMYHSVSKDCAMPQAVSRQVLTAEARVRSPVSPCGVCGVKCGTVTGFPASTFLLPCQCHTTNAPHSSSSTRCSYHQHKRPNLRTFQKQRSAVNRGTFATIILSLSLEMNY